MRDLNYQLKLLCKHSHEGSFETRVGLERQLSAPSSTVHACDIALLQLVLWILDESSHLAR